MPLPTTYLFAWAPFLTSRAKLHQFIHTTLGPETLRRRPKFVQVATDFLTDPGSAARLPATAACRAS